ncbi:MAG TPA: hypothetical protein VE135_05350 [Pyrinomonadaceae bacterium]|nr:hypothetical protein [Pyrinomonadaceae bacterium]
MDRNKQSRVSRTVGALDAYEQESLIQLVPITSDSSRPHNALPGFYAGVLSVFEHLLAIHKNVSDAN